MPIYVCVKHVPDTGAVIALQGKNAFVEQGIKFIMNPYDEYAMEEALQWAADLGEEVVAVTLGKTGAASTLQAALALGASRGIHVLVETQDVPPSLTAKGLAAAIRREGAPRAVFVGKQSIDTEGMQVPYLLGLELDLPVVNEVSSLSRDGDTVRAVREVGSGAKETLTLSLPCVIGATKGLNIPRYPKLPDIMKAKKKPVAVLPAAALFPPDAARRTREELTLTPERSSGTRAVILQGALEEQVAELRRIFKEKVGI